MNASDLTCRICSKVFATNPSRNRHYKCVHKIVYIPRQEFDLYNNKCLEKDCKLSFRLLAELRSHLQKVHHISIEQQSLTFNTMSAFEEWFERICTEQEMQYVRHKMNDKLIYFNCHRSGNSRGKCYKDNGKRKRALKTQGYSKIGSNCTSQIILKNTEEDNYWVTYYKTHYGHKTDLEHLNIPKGIRQEIADGLKTGESSNSIIENIQAQNISRLASLSKKDISNIRRAFNISNTNSPNNISRQDSCYSHEDIVINGDFEAKQLVFTQSGENDVVSNTSQCDIEEILVKEEIEDCDNKSSIDKEHIVQYGDDNTQYLYLPESNINENEHYLKNEVGNEEDTSQSYTEISLEKENAVRDNIMEEINKMVDSIDICNDVNVLQNVLKICNNLNNFLNDQLHVQLQPDN